MSGATANRADNLVDLSANGLATTGALTNFQIADADITSSIGLALDLGGVTVSVAENVSYSTIAVDGNAISGSVTGNSANNTVTAEGTDVPDGSDHFATWATTDGASTTALGDYMLANSQIVGDRDLTSLVYGRFSIEVADSADIWETTLSVDDNSQASRAVANTVSNSVELDAVNTAAGAALVSNQDSAADVVAVSNLDVTAPGAATASSISMSGNSNLALATINNASNSVVVSATNAGSVTFARDVLLDADTDEVAVGDHVLLNRQLASNVVTANAVTSVHNGDTLPGFDSIDLSSVTVTGNATSAEASGNRAFNSMDIEGTASLGASAGMLNVQASTATV
ncbi:MAG: hypothetical protein B7Z52_05515 [Burkholderiales bacterium 12-64-5]|nr:MAG: hypothetical protein B7Z52_05515 [Burkholderiales bacterium 12-64-5]